jgi:hypothetical protein
VQLLQKFVHQSRFGIFCNEHTRSTPLDPKLMFWCVSYYFGAFATVSLLHETHCKTSRTDATKAKFVQWSGYGIFTTNSPDPHHWTLNTYFCASSNDWVHFVSFHYFSKLGAQENELVQLMQKFVQRSGFKIFRNECTRSQPLDPKLKFWCIS